MKEIEAAERDFGILDHVPIGIFVLRRDLVVLFWNNCLEDWTGISRKKIIGTNIGEHFSHLNSPEYCKRLQSVFEGGPPTIFSSQLHKYVIPSRLWDGQMRIQHTTVTAVSAADGMGFNALFAIQDVTDLTHRIQGYRKMRDQALEEIKERKKAEEELRNAHEKLEIRVKERTAELNTLVDHMLEGVVLLDAGHRIILANRIGEVYLKIVAKSGIGDVLTVVAGYPLEDFLVSDPHKMWREVRIDDPPSYVFEVAGRSVLQNNAPRGMVLVLKDVTEERTIEERINSQDRLAAVGQLAEGIAHDFNNILTGIIGFADILLADYELPYEEKQMVEAILQNGERAAQLVRQILDFSSRSISELQLINLVPLLKEFSKFIGRTIPENIAVSIECRPGEYIVHGDPAKIQQVLTNLSLNARDAMTQGGRLQFELSRIDIGQGDATPMPDMPFGDWVVLKVSDTGTGIASDVLPHIFEPFFTTKGVGRGSGLGLSQVYGIVKQHNGYIELKTELGKSTAFIIYLPAIKVKAGAALSKDEGGRLKGHEEAILVVEDNEAVRNLMRRKLSKLDYRVLTASNGKEALSVFNNNRDDIKLIITDVVMPEMGGIELGRIIKAQNPSIKIIALTGYPLGSKREDLLQSGIEECIQKPFQGSKLTEAVSRALEKMNGQK